MTQVPITENQLGTMQMVEEVSEYVEMNCEIPDSRYEATSSFLGRKQDQP